MHLKYKSPILFCLIVFLVNACRSESIEKNSIKEGAFKASITETGELQAIQSKVIPMPFIGWKYGWQFKIIQLAEHGQKISAGDTVAQIDPAPVIRVLEEQRTRLESEQASLQKLHMVHKNALSQLDSELKSEKANRDLISLQLEKFSFETERKKEQKQLELDIASIKLRDIQGKLEKKKIVFEKELQIQLIRIEQIKKSIGEAENALKKLTIVSPIDGIVQLERRRRSRKMVQLGDEIHQGRNISRIPDMSMMKVFATINEIDISKIFPGQEVIVRLDAYPEKAFVGKVDYIGRLSFDADDNSLVKVFAFEVLLDDSDEALKPGMTVSCELILNELEKSLFVENECIFSDEEGFYIIARNTSKKVPVEILSVNNNYSAISGDIKKGQKLLNMDEYKLTQSKP